MIDFTLIQYIKIAILGGLLGTAGMTSVLYIFDRVGLANGDMVRAIGSLLTKSYENALIPGLIIHLLSGVFFTLVYAVLMDYFGSPSLAMAITYGTAMGVFHGAVVALLLVVAAEHHPVDRFQQTGFAVAFVHWGAHVVFGFIVGLMIGVTTL